EPQATDRLLSLTDRDARTGKPGEYYDGYLLDVSLDADSELICALDVLPANGDEGANAKFLIMSEEHAQGNDIGSLSIDRIGCRGDVLADLSDAAHGPHLTVYVPRLTGRHPRRSYFSPRLSPLTTRGRRSAVRAGREPAPGCAPNAGMAGKS